MSEGMRRGWTVDAWAAGALFLVTLVLLVWTTVRLDQAERQVQAMRSPVAPRASASAAPERPRGGARREREETLCIHMLTDYGIEQAFARCAARGGIARRDRFEISCYEDWRLLFKYTPSDAITEDDADKARAEMRQRTGAGGSP